MDGDIDYAGYTRRDLEEALRTIDRARYPKNYEKLCDRLAVAPPDPPPPPKRRPLSDRWRILLAGALLLVACVWTFDTLPYLLQAVWEMTLGTDPAIRNIAGGVPLAASMFFLVLYAATIATGVALLKRSRSTTLLGCLLFGAQLFSIRIDGFAYHFVTFASVRLRFEDGNVGLTASLGREFGVGLEHSATRYFAIDFFALALIILVMRLRSSRASADYRLERP